ncbi:MAG: hypothetical protein CMJ18_26630 [Phycisphaeraceae bacterium]|nr:hypothetical protein [Phycisphaeraceae bacterium]
MEKVTRREWLAMAAGAAIGAGAAGAYRAGSRSWSTPMLRPPGARDESHFLAACIRCGQCVQACPFDTLNLVQCTLNCPMGIRVMQDYALKGRAVDHPACTRCGSCVDACPGGVLSLRVRAYRAAPESTAGRCYDAVDA